MKQNNCSIVVIIIGTWGKGGGRREKEGGEGWKGGGASGNSKMEEPRATGKLRAPIECRIRRGRRRRIKRDRDRSPSMIQTKSRGTTLSYDVTVSCFLYDVTCNTRR